MIQIYDGLPLGPFNRSTKQTPPLDLVAQALGTLLGRFTDEAVGTAARCIGSNLLANVHGES